jgi:hypothetical protein
MLTLLCIFSRVKGMHIGYNGACKLPEVVKLVVQLVVKLVVK